MDENKNLIPENNNLDNIQNTDNKNKKDFTKLIVINIGLLVIVAFAVIFLFNISNSNKPLEYTGSESGDILQDQEGKTSTDETQTNTSSTVVSTNTGTGIDTAPDESTSKDCNVGKNDDYLHPERFINPDGTLKCADGVVIFDHQIAPKFRRTIIPYIEEETGMLIDLNGVDFYITLLETGETVKFEDIFNWYEDGKRTIFNTNKLLYERWGEYIGDNNTYTFGVSMIHEPTGADISIIFKDHTTMTLYFDGLNGN